MCPCAAEGVAIARRSSGGGTVVIGPGTLNVTVILPATAAPGLAAVDTAQAYVLDRMAQAIRRHGPAVERLGSGDLTLERRKFSGSAQRRLRNHFLVHATLLYRFPLALVERYTNVPRRQPAYRENRSHAEFLVNLHLPARSWWRPSRGPGSRPTTTSAPPRCPKIWSPSSSGPSSLIRPGPSGSDGIRGRTLAFKRFQRPDPWSVPILQANGRLSRLISEK